jgi:hypothetical protein
MNRLIEVPLEEAHNYITHSEFIKHTLKKQQTFSSVCIFCSCKESIPLSKDGAFRNCKRCNKQFKAKIVF